MFNMVMSARHGGNMVFMKVDIDSFSEEVPNMMRPDGRTQPLHGFSQFRGKGREKAKLSEVGGIELRIQKKQK